MQGHSLGTVLAVAGVLVGVVTLIFQLLMYRKEK